MQHYSITELFFTKIISGANLAASGANLAVSGISALMCIGKESTFASSEFKKGAKSFVLTTQFVYE